jgi:membrane protease YdiL (CAAX protease family)
MKEKKHISPNECSLGRWIVVLLVGLVVGILPSIPLNAFLTNNTDTIMGIPYATFFGTLLFVPLFFGIVLSIRLIGKTSLKDFVLGVNGKINFKQCLIIAGLYAAGFATAHLFIIRNISPRGVKIGQFAFLVLFMLLVAWMQTTFEELVFRGIILRWACKNTLGYTKKALISTAIGSLAFAIAHAVNPEVTSQKGIFILLGVLTYAIPSLVYFWANIHFGNLMPGIIIHWVNNFALFTLISTNTGAVSVPSLLMDSTPQNAPWMFISTLIAHVPVMIYIIIDMIKRKKAATVAD